MTAWARASSPQSGRNEDHRSCADAGKGSLANMGTAKTDKTANAADNLMCMAKD
jgi:hypothetical protein